MLDPHLIRNQLDEVAAALKKRGMQLDTKTILDLDAQRKEIQVKTEELQNQRNSRSREIGKVKGRGGDIEPLLKEVATLGDKLKEHETSLSGIQDRLNVHLMGIPNIPHESVPEGNSEEDNEEQRRWGDPKQFDFTVRDHVELGEQNGLLDFEAGTRIAGSRFAVFSGGLATLHRALIQLMLDTH
ncbi:MAG: serine--tRNA ligase, partial [Thiotrichales bacterium]|nr:serine--tRNA ligase [Thiotrichales bacterium]